MKKNQKIFLMWFILVVAWNFGFPAAAPVHDVLVAIILYTISTQLNKKL